jgi:hypothetical protein
MSLIRHRPLPFASLAVMALLACGGDSSEPRPITKERRWQPVGSTPIAGVSSEERFGYERRPTATDESAGKTTPGLAWDTPHGWRELPPRSMRLADFHVAGDERAECYLSILGGDGGGLVANVNRWRGQMSLPPVGEEALAAAPRVPFLGGDALLIDLSGTWVGMDGEQAGTNYRMLGLIAVDAGGARFLKMTGPADVIEPEVEAFMDLAGSFRLAGARAPVAADVAQGERSPGGLTWRAPESWRRAGDRPMREVTYLLGADGEAECYVSLLSGTAGGVFANVNRWRTQMGQGELSASEFALLQRIPMLDTEGIVVEVDGTYRGMGDELIEEAALLGAVCELAGRAAFVKLIGPEDVVRGARDEFLAFCQSLEAN